MVDLTINNHYKMIRLHCITIGNAPIIIGLPWLRKHNPNIDWREGWLTFNSARCAKECLISSPHATTVSEKKAMGEYYRDIAQDAVSQDMVCSIAIVDVETFEEESEDGRKGVMTWEHIEEILDAWEAYHAEMRTTEPWQRETAEALTTGDIVPREYPEYLHVFGARDDRGLPLHRYHDYEIPLLDGKALPFEPIQPLDEKKLWALREYLETNLEWGWIRNSTSPTGAPIYFV
jgi:hypothetical protein